MREEIKQVKEILKGMGKLIEIIKGVTEISTDMLLSLKYTIEGVNETIFQSTYLQECCAYEAVIRYEEEPYQVSELLEEVAKWYQMVIEKVNLLETKCNYVDYDFYVLMNYVQMVPKNVLLGDMIHNFEKNKEKGMENYVSFVDFFNRHADFWGTVDIEAENYELFEKRIDELKEHSGDFIWLYENLEDYRSKLVLSGILNYWVNYNNTVILKIRENSFASYYDLDLMKSTENEVFVDLGAYTGDSAEEFIYHMGSYKHIYCYEIAKDTFEQLKAAMEPYENVTLCNKGVADKKGIMYVDSVQDASNHKVVTEGTETVEVTTLDDDIKEKITLIKMDIEGGEQAALRGAREHITNEKPKLAICTYHNNTDIWKIPRMMREMNPEYKLYMRYNGPEYGYNVTEFVTFGI